jgi:amino acid transporter
MFFGHRPARKLRIFAVVFPFFMTALLPQGAVAAAYASATPTGKLMSVAQGTSKHAIIVAILMAIVTLVFVLRGAAATGQGSFVALAGVLVVTICLFVFKFDPFRFFDFFFGDVKSDKAAHTHPRHVVPHPPSWFEKYWWVVVLAAVSTGLLVIAIYFVVLEKRDSEKASALLVRRVQLKLNVERCKKIEAVKEQAKPSPQKF